jgi:hypothetical protein
MNRAGVLAVAIGAAFALVSIGVAADEIAGEITASVGTVPSGALAEGEHVKLGEDGACSILVDQDAVVELCGQTSLLLRRDERSNRRIVALDRGEIRIVVEPRAFEERIEIHTPAAIATLLGTIVHVSVDPTTGATTISSAESQVAVRSGDPQISGTTIVDASQQLTVMPGVAPPAEPQRLDREQLSELGGCLVDFHSAALGRDSHDHDLRVAERLTMPEIAAHGEGGQLPQPATATPDGVPLPNAPGEPLAAQDDVCVVTDCEPNPADRDPGSKVPEPPLRNIQVPLFFSE